MSKVIVLTVLAVVALLALVRYGRRSAAPPGTTVPLRAPVGSPEADAQTLRALRDAGADLAKPTEVRYYLYFPTRAAAERAAAAARTPEFAAEVRGGADGTTWLCRATAHIVPSDSAIRAATTRLEALAESLGGAYDGWEAAVTPRRVPARRRPNEALQLTGRDASAWAPRHPVSKSTFSRPPAQACS